jgi:predicted GNAT family acetyltransferase
MKHNPGETYAIVIRNRSTSQCRWGACVFAALGNIATRPGHRGRGFATAVIAELCRSLLLSVDHVGLNVKADNLSAIGCYQRLGFEQNAVYGEYTLELR